MTHPADKFIKFSAGPFGYTRECTICGHFDYRKIGFGRGAGMREGNKQRGRLLQHIKAEHPEALKED